MYKVINNRSRLTTVAVPGRGLILAKRGSFDFLLDGEVLEETVQALVKAKIVTVEKCGGGTVAPSETVTRERRRIDVTTQAHERAALRARGIQPKKPQPAKKAVAPAPAPAPSAPTKKQPKPKKPHRRAGGKAEESR